MPEELRVGDVVDVCCGHDDDGLHFEARLRITELRKRADGGYDLTGVQPIEWSVCGPHPSGPTIRKVGHDAI